MPGTGYTGQGFDAIIGLRILPGRLPEMQALKDVITTLPGFEAFFC